MPVRTVIFEDTKFDVKAFLYLLERIPDIRVVGIYSTPREAMTQCQKLKPDLIIADADFGGDQSVGPAFVKFIKQALPKVKVLGATRYLECTAPMKSAGCDFVVLKQVLDDEQETERFIREALYDIFIDEKVPLPPRLEPQEDQVLRLIRDGMTEQEMAAELKCTHGKIRRIKEKLYEKFSVTKETSLISEAYRTGYFSPNS